MRILERLKRLEDHLGLYAVPLPDGRIVRFSKEQLSDTLVEICNSEVEERPPTISPDMRQAITALSKRGDGTFYAIAEDFLADLRE